MAAPATTTRTTPAGKLLEDGYQALIAFERDPDVSFWEKSVGSPSLDGGDPIDITTQHSSTWRTMSPRSLITSGEFTVTAAYDPDVHNNIVNNLLNQRGSVTITYPDGSTLDFYGFLRVFEPQPMVEGTQPEANITITPTNYDPVNDVEEAPVLTSVAGT